MLRRVVRLAVLLPALQLAAAVVVSPRALVAQASAQTSAQTSAHASAQASAQAAGGDSIDVPVATRRLARGTVLDAGDFRITRIAAGGVASRGRVDVQAGWVARRVIRAGEVLRAPAVDEAPLVSAGQAVRFSVLQDGLALTLDGVAPVAGSLGDTIPVRLGARRRVTGVVAGPAHVVALVSSRLP